MLGFELYTTPNSGGHLLADRKDSVPRDEVIALQVQEELTVETATITSDGEFQGHVFHHNLTFKLFEVWDR